MRPQPCEFLINAASRSHALCTHAQDHKGNTLLVVMQWAGDRLRVTRTMVYQEEGVVHGMI